MFDGLKRMVRMVFRRPTTWMGGVWRHRIAWYKGVGDVTNSSTVAPTVMWCARNFPEAPPALWKLDESAQRERRINHDMLRLLQRPNPFFTGVQLWMATVTDWKTSGEAYWWKNRNGFGRPAELWWIPSWLIRPVGDENTYITHYEYAPNSEVAPLRLDTADVVPFRFGVDPDDPLRGLSPLKCVLREVFTDDEAATFTASILGNMGVPGVVFSPDQPIDRSTAQQAKDSISEGFTGARRGEPMVMTVPSRVEQFGFSPEQLVLTEIRRIPEERVTAALGVPAIVVGLGAGLDRSTFTNMGEASEYAYSNGLIPDQRIMADVIRWNLLSDFEPDPFMWEFGFDLSQVRALKEDVTKQAQRWNTLIGGGWAMVSEGRKEMGLPVDPNRDNIFLRPANYSMVDSESGDVTPLKGVAPPGDIPATPDTAAELLAEEMLDVHRQHSRGMLELAAAVASRPSEAPRVENHLAFDAADLEPIIEPILARHRATEITVEYDDHGRPVAYRRAGGSDDDRGISVAYDEAGRPDTYTRIGEG